LLAAVAVALKLAVEAVLVAIEQQLVFPLQQALP
jgi:hypothetical protein